MGLKQHELLEGWNCTDCVTGLVFDSTTSNTEAITAGCVSIQNVLNRPHLWLACRHHIGDIILTHVWNTHVCLKIEISKGPNINLFLRFKKNFEQLNCQTIEDLGIPQVSQSLINKKDTITNLCQEGMRQNFNRGNYRELVQLTLLYLSNGKDVLFSGFVRPGALHNTRWMAKLLYSIKLVQLNKKISQLLKGTIFAQQQLSELQRIVKFVVFLYIPWWLSVPISSAAPTNDLNLINSLSEYKVIDFTIANAALKAFSNHMWYLTEELASLSLFNNNFEDKQRQKITNKILSLKNYVTLNEITSKRKGSGFGKPIILMVPKKPVNDLTDFIGEDSPIFFTILNINSNFLREPVTEWYKNEDFLASENVVSS